MLPFLKNKQDVSASTPMETKERKPDMDTFDSMDTASQDVLDAIKANDVKALSAALRAACELCDSEPHEEGSHTNEE